MLYLINTLAFAFLFTIWTRSNILNTFIKFAFLLLLIVNGIGFYVVGSQQGWLNLAGFRFF